MHSPELMLSEIRFINDGRISVTLRKAAADDPPALPIVDVIEIRVYMEYAPTDTIEKIESVARQMVSTVLK